MHNICGTTSSCQSIPLGYEHEGRYCMRRTEHLGLPRSSSLQRLREADVRSRRHAHLRPPRLRLVPRHRLRSHFQLYFVTLVMAPQLQGVSGVGCVYMPRQLHCFGARRMLLSVRAFRNYMGI